MARYGWLRPGDVPNDTDSDDDEDMEVVSQDEPTQQDFTPKISLEQYEVQKREFTKASLENLLNSAEYQRRLHTCGSCWCNWLLGQCTQTCLECGAYTMKRPCPICQGKCQKEWNRDVEMSHAMFEAHWDGECGLPEEERNAHMYATFLDGAGEDEMLDGLQDLSAS